MSNEQTTSRLTSEEVVKPVEPKQETVKQFSLQVTPSVFEGELKCKVLTATQLSKLVCQIFEPVFRDFAGVNIGIDNYGKITTDAYFLEKPSFKDDGKLQNIINIKKSNAGTTPVTLSDRVRLISQNNTNRALYLTEETKQILLPFIPNNFASRNRSGVRSVNWDQATYEASEEVSSSFQSQHMPRVVYLAVPLDISTLVSTIFEAKDKEGYAYEYQIAPYRSIPSNNPDFIMMITQADNKSIERLSNDLGIMTTPSTHSIRMVKA